MSESLQRYPLQWPTGWKRTAGDRRRARFESQRKEWRAPGPYAPAGTTGHYVAVRNRLSVADAIKRLSLELRRLGVLDGDWLISSNVRTRLDGLPYSKAAEPDDPGVALYFRFGSKRDPRVLACDKWDRVGDNIGAIAWHIDAVRAQDRYGVGSLEQAFAGYAALPANTTEQWWIVFGLDQTSTFDEVEAAFRLMARAAHPDAGGSDVAMARLNEARARAHQAILLGV